MKAADQLHSTLLEGDNVRRVEPAALSLVQHMWALSDAVRIAYDVVVNRFIIGDLNNHVLKCSFCSTV